MSRWSERPDVPRGSDYDARWKALAAAGESIHGEADLVEAVLDECAGLRHPRSVLDAGCGTGRVAIELAARGFDVVGVDLDEAMLGEAQAKAPGLRWVLADLVDVDLGRTFDLVVMAGNVMIFVAPGTEAAVLAAMARHVTPGGIVIAGFQLGGAACRSTSTTRRRGCGLALVDRWATWERHPYGGGEYAVSMHRRS
ncbi:MAG: class I SAM-dependent methyltransferase [Acidimicrobiales bacterium]